MRTNKDFSRMSELATFVRVAESGSFSEAARQLGSTPSAISRAVDRLERQLGTRLLQRTTRKLRLTDAGETVLAHGQAMVGAAKAALEAVDPAGQAPGGRLCISAPRALGRFLIHPLMPAFLAAHPRIDLVFRLEDREVDLIDERVDVAFRIGDAPSPGLMGRRLLRIEHLLCATPAYLRVHGVPTHPKDLRQHSCITLSEDPIDARWRFERDGKTTGVDVRGRYTANHSGVRLDAVLSDLGVGSLPDFIAREALAAGQVVPVLPDWAFRTNYQGDVWALYPPTRHLPSRVRAFIEHMGAALAPGRRRDTVQAP